MKPHLRPRPRGIGCALAIASAAWLLGGCTPPPLTPPGAQTPAIAPAASAPAAAPPPAAPAASTAPAASAAPAVDPGVLQTLDTMGKYLGQLRTFELRTASTTDEMLDNDQMAQFSHHATLRVRRPNGLRADVRGDRGEHKLLYFNGRTVSLYNPEERYYATVNAPATIGETVRLLQQRYDIELPVADLFAWESGMFEASRFKSADFLGYAEIDGRMTTHFALRQPGVDWQIWIERGDTPLPLKLVITTTELAARPQYVVLLRWNLAPRLAAAEFDFKPPPGAYRILIQNADGTVARPGASK